LHQRGQAYPLRALAPGEQEALIDDEWFHLVGDRECVGAI